MPGRAQITAGAAALARMPYVRFMYALGVALSPLTLLRLPNVSIGVSEALLLLWAGIVLVYGKIRHAPSPERDTPSRLFLTPLYVLLFITPLGMVWNLVTVNNDFSTSHDLVAFLFNLLLMFLLIKASDIVSMPVIYTVFFVGVQSALNLFYLFYFFTGNGIYYGERFQGLSNDPNQVAEGLILLPVFALYLMRRYAVTNRLFLALLLAGIGAGIYIGMKTDSDSLMLGWVIGLFIVAMVEFMHLINKREKIPVKILKVGLYLLLSLVAVYRLEQVNLSTFRYVTAIEQKDNQEVVRTAIWQNAYKAFLNSPVVGNGPGAFAGNWFPFGKVEAHNTYLYIMMDYGVVGLIAFLFVIVYLLVQVIRSSDSLLIAGYFALLIFMVFHSFHRMPIFWFYLMLFYAFTRAIQRRREARAQASYGYTLAPAYYAGQKG